MNDVIETLLNHRSIRKFTDRPIDSALLESILRAGQSAATSSFVQAYSLVRITDPWLREQLAELAGNQPYVASCAEFFVCCADLARNKSLCEQAGVPADAGYIEQLIIATVDTAMMAQNMVTAAESAGLGSCYIGGLRNNPQQVSDLLALPDFVYPVFGLCLGYPAQDPEPKPRLPLSLWVQENRYQPTKFDQALERYDQEVRQYYETRTGNRKSTTWSEQTLDFLAKESRPFMLDFLQARGLAKH